MAIARAFTMRAKRSDSNPQPTLPYRSGTVKNLTGREVSSNMISAPTFVSTTNTLALNAPNVESIRALRSKAFSVSSSTSSISSADESDNSSTRSRSRDTSLTDASSVEGSPSSSPTPYADVHFGSSKPRLSQVPHRAKSSTDLRSKIVLPTEDVPAIPERAMSHSKSAHEAIARKRSLQNIGLHSRTHSRSRSTVSTISRKELTLEPFNLDVPIPSPSLSLSPIKPLSVPAKQAPVEPRSFDSDPDTLFMQQKNLARFDASDYLLDLQPLYVACFSHSSTKPSVDLDNLAGWI